MNHGQVRVTDEVERYLLTGSSDPVYAAWPGNITERAVLARADLRGALLAAIKQKQAKGKRKMPASLDAVALTRAEVEPMVRGLFPPAEWTVLLAMLEKSLVFLTSGNIETVLIEENFDYSAWTLANLYLAGLGRELLSPDAPNLVGLSQDTTCYVSPQYFQEQDRFADFVVHEAAHVFHNCKRGMLGLRETRSKVWLLDIEYRKRETFAYSCEAYARILELGTARQNGRRWPTNFPGQCVSQMSAWTATRWRGSSKRLPPSGSAGRLYSRNAHRFVASPTSLRKSDHSEKTT